MVGAGVVGLAVARALALAGREVIMLDAAEGIGTETSSRNSEVIHAGIYYPAGSLMARFCVAGRRALYAYCAEKGVPHANCGKLIVATNAQEDAMLAGIKRRAEANGVEGMRVLTRGRGDRRWSRTWLAPARCCRLPPASSTATPSCWRCRAMPRMPARCRYSSARSLAGAWCGAAIEIDVGGADPMTPALPAAGEFGRPARAGSGRAHRRDAAGPRSARLLRQGQLFHPVRPVAVLAADLSGAGAGRAGRAPDDRPGRPGAVRSGRGVDRRRSTTRSIRARADSFYAAVRRYWPALKDGALQPGYAGIRPKIVPRGAPAQDFVVQGPQTHGVPGLINLFGIESPGLTASLALADHVVEVAATG